MTHRTKWDIIQAELQLAKEAVAKIERNIKWMEETPFTANDTGQCSGCGEVLATEADFAKHFPVPDERYRNLGYCPNKP